MLKLHQALHGYSDGHRLLASSINLPAKDARLMLVISDVSGPGITSTGLSYITGYPLAESGLYALAKTWPAPEMERPGCVWTHTLLISFTDLAALMSPSIITHFFRHPPVKVTLQDYASEVVLDQHEYQDCLPLTTDESSWFAKLACAVYEHPEAQVWARRADGFEVDEAVLRLWDQQWPRLKRSFRFCTLTSRDRSQDGMPFDLQLTSAGETNSLLRFASAAHGVEATDKLTEPWLEDLLNDAQHPQDSSLRPFLKRLGADMQGSREAMQPFCSLHASLGCASAASIRNAVLQAQSLPLFASSDLVKMIVAQTAIANLGAADDDVFDFIIGALPLLPETTISKYQEPLIQLLWESNPRKVLALANDSRADVRAVIRSGVESITPKAVIRQFTHVSDFVESVMDLFPFIVEEPSFWSCSKLNPLKAFQAGIELSKDVVLRAMILGLQEPSLIDTAVKIVGAAVVFEQLQKLVNSKNDLNQAQHWLRFACVDSNALALFIARASLPSRKLLLLIADATQPDAVPNDFGTDPWFLALHALALAEGALPIELQVYGFRRALGRRSRNVEDLLKLTFEKLHVAAEKKSIPEELWRKLEDSLPRASIGQEWDLAIRLRVATACKCNDTQLRAEGLAHLVASDSLFIQLLEEIWEQLGGKGYLRSVNNALLASKASCDAQRSNILNKFINKNLKFWWE